MATSEHATNDIPLVAELNQLIQNTELQCFSLTPSAYRPNKSQIQIVINHIAPEATPTSIIGLMVEFTYHTFCVNSFLNDLISFHNERCRATRREAYVLAYWQIDLNMKFKDKTKKKIIADAMTFHPELIREVIQQQLDSSLSSAIANLLYQKLRDCMIVCVPEPDTWLKSYPRKTEILLVGTNSNSENYVGIHCGFNNRHSWMSAEFLDLLKQSSNQSNESR